MIVRDEQLREMWRRANDLPVSVSTHNGMFFFSRGNTYFSRGSIAEAMDDLKYRFEQESITPLSAFVKGSVGVNAG